ncbi:MAG TPA: kelch repeat-containing protein [Pyrinomonadaceae bacterium]
MRNRRDYARCSFVLILAAVGLILGMNPFAASSGLAHAQVAAPSWSFTGSLNTPRYGHTATLLPNGKVLVAGGGGGYTAEGGYSITNTAELYDPATGTWSVTGSLNVLRWFHTATLLPNGQVLVVGGIVDNSPTNTAELYDPATGTWRLTGNLNAPRAWHTATLLQNGKVLVAGGSTGYYSITDTTELYDPATGAWSAAETLHTTRFLHTATLLQDGKVLVAGGCFDGDCDIALNSAELYDPNVGGWSLTANPNAMRESHTATLLSNGQVLLAGGGRQSHNLHTNELYNPATGRWSFTDSLSRRADHTATLLPNGQVLVAGGSNYGLSNNPADNTLSSAALYDPATGHWSATASLNAARYFHTATLLQNGKVLVVGGYDGRSAPTTVFLRSAELYDSGASSFTNPIDDPQFFIRQQYLDFLGREPDPIGFQGWQDILRNCAQGDTRCDRIEVSSAFFRSAEFQDRGYFIYRFYSTFGRIPHYSEFMPDLAKVSGFLTPEQLEANKAAFVNEFITRPEFKNKFDSLTDPTAYVDALLQTAGLSNHPTRNTWVAGLTNGTTTRAQVLRALVESAEVYFLKYNEAFVVMEYFGYLRRDPDILYLEWIKTMNGNGGDYRVMINGFMNSVEYRKRFGP